MKCKNERTRGIRTAGILFAVVCVSLPVLADRNYSQQVFFENGVSATGSYFYSAGKPSAPSRLELVSGRLPLDTSHFVSGPNSLRLQWQSMPGGSWSVEVSLPTWPNRFINFPGKNLYVWLYANADTQSGALPKFALRDRSGGFTHPMALSAFSGNLAHGKWVRVRIPFARLQSASLHKFQSAQTSGIVFLQGDSDAAPHTLLIDDIRIEDDAPINGKLPAAPIHLRATGYERHVDLSWDAPDDGNVAQYVVYRSIHGAPYQAIGVQRNGVHRYEDYLGDDHARASYKVSARTSAMRESAFSKIASASTHSMTDAELLSMVQQASFRYYWDGAEPHSGMARESNPGNDDVVAVGGSGFGIMSLVVAADRGFALRQAIVDRLLRITDFLAHADRYHGAWPHYLSGSTGRMLPVFGIYDDGADLVETSFLMQGLLTARGYFNQDNTSERELRNRITRLWEGVEWDWFAATPNKDALYWHWSPDFGFRLANRLQGWNETMITYLLAIASPTHPVPASLYYTGWAAEGNPSHSFGKGATFYGIKLDMTYTPNSPGPLFFTHYSYLGYDPRSVRDKYANYFVNNRNESLVQQQYAIENPKHFIGYGADAWGLSAVTGPHGYREYKPFTEDDGTLAPTAAVSAYAYTPGPSLLAIKHFYRDLGAQVWDIYGFRNAFNQQLDWYSPDELGLNQGPQVVMIENGRTGLLWRSFMANAEMKKMQAVIGMKPDPQD
jgi:exo beta-1,2-glucooligosaccharide sophorohydrolase (non-reducing end)